MALRMAAAPASTRSHEQRVQPPRSQRPEPHQDADRAERDQSDEPAADLQLSLLAHSCFLSRWRTTSQLSRGDSFLDHCPLLCKSFPPAPLAQAPAPLRMPLTHRSYTRGVVHTLACVAWQISEGAGLRPGCCLSPPGPFCTRPLHPPLTLEDARAAGKLAECLRLVTPALHPQK